MTALAEPLQVVLYEGKGSRPFENRGELMLELLEKGCPVTTTGELGAKARVSGTSASKSAVLVLGRFQAERPESAVDESGEVAVHFRDVEGKGREDIAALVDEVRALAELPEREKWKPWFPVIDYDRCTDCMQCLSFCLFGVYGVDDKGSIKVQNESNCKTDCPACSRVCPDVAILFPKYRQGPINGANIDTEDVRREAMKVDISALLGGDIYQALKDRSAKAKSRFAKERDDDRALKERLKCLNELQGKMDIPTEVLQSLPSLSEIQRKAEEAKARAQEALNRKPDA